MTHALPRSARILAALLAAGTAAAVLTRATHKPALAAPPAIGSEDHQILSPHGPWVRSLTIPGSGASCCDESDCRPVVHATTTGWEPTCSCHIEHAPIPCSVLDPFGGSGTTALVADRLGRHATIVDLNPEYREMARERIRQDAPLLTVVA